MCVIELETKHNICVMVTSVGVRQNEIYVHILEMNIVCENNCHRYEKNVQLKKRTQQDNR